MDEVRRLRLRMGSRSPAARRPRGTGAGTAQLSLPGCELAGAEVVRGDELEVESIEVADETPATAPANQA